MELNQWGHGALFIPFPFLYVQVMPYVSTMERKLRAPCDGCAPPYGFRNDLPLTKKVDEFKRRVKRALGERMCPVETVC